MLNTSRSTSSRATILLGLAVGSSAALTGCDAPESGSLENAKSKQAPVEAARIDYAKLDYTKIDYTKIDHSKIDLTKFSDEQKAKVATANISLVAPMDVAGDLKRRLGNRQKVAIAAKDDVLVAEIDAILKSISLADKLAEVGNLCW
jgi:hypothetical protein